MLRAVDDCHSSFVPVNSSLFDVVLEKDLESVNKVCYESIERHVKMMLLFTASMICFFGHFLRECTGCPVASYMTAIIINRDLQPKNRSERVVIVVPGRWTIIIESITELTLQYVIFAARRLFLYMSSFVITCHIRREYAVMHYIPFPCFVWRIASVRDSSVTWHVMGHTVGL